MEKVTDKQAEQLASTFEAALAFERFMEDAPQSLWRVVYMQKLTNKAKLVRSIEYFNDEKAAWDFVGRLTERGPQVLRCDQFNVVPRS